MADNACEKTAFVTHYGLFEYTILPLGLCNAPFKFQYLMNAVMSGYIDDFILVYLDDIPVYSDNAEEHEAHLHKVFDRLYEYKLQAKLKSASSESPVLSTLVRLLVLVNFTWIRTRWMLFWNGSHQKTLRVCSSS